MKLRVKKFPVTPKLDKVKITVASVAVRTRSERFDGLAAEYLDRLKAYAETDAQVFKSCEALFEWAGRLKSRTSPVMVLLDEHGKQLSSEALADWLRRVRDEGQQRIVFALGPADGWSHAERLRASLLLSLGPMTLPHELARVVVSEQIYRAFTILAGHPYHRGD
ncbi:MAG: 23S rRNA (pseudouridine(1915)-N(3))-methyltransferase RlmH [Silvibacterium sp.]